MQKMDTTSKVFAPQRIVMYALAVSLLTLSAKVSVPFLTVPMTLQVAAVLLLAGLGGLRFGASSVASYLAAGAAGLPVFAGTPEKGLGLAYMVGPTGGYLLGFLVAAIGVGWAVDRFGRQAVWLAMPMGLAAIYALGVAWLSQFVPSEQLLALGVTPFLLGDIVKVALAAVLTVAAPTALRRFVRG
ncbi:biotin biosynthesis protein BioY [Jannaschia pagri]|uniref:Biotin transporter n=1 Tax=Jannaschia pagri TaxID=2829797 RepID=A0ABQ4NRI5_9RHOB|nr:MULTISPECIES: biotin transporter BioY [unclassified Jannaschia]GIT93208.1 biotin biosynthesis protein BioY [Jannaschia sp. AI_61]GIT97025.1 biotin biosynthesis protein BioY [Jannaschia sp. AI_62]